MKTYVYALKSKAKKDRDVLLKYGFNAYESEDGETIYGMPLKLKLDSSICKYLKRAIEKIYIHATTKEREEDFKDYKFNEILTVDQKRDYDLEITPELEKELTECQICMYTEGEGADCLFINAPDRVEYYSSIVLDECIGGVIEVLLEQGIIYKKRVWKNRKDK